MNNLCKNLGKLSFKSLYNYEINRVFVRNVRAFVKKGVDEPKYLDFLRPQIPYYPLLNIQIRGFDFAVLESYAKYLHHLSNRLGVNVVRVWCSPHSALKYDLLKPESEVSETQFLFNVYERNIQIENLSAKMAPILLQIVLSSMPSGVKVSVQEHDYWADEESRYIPDIQLAAFKAELLQLKGSLMEEESTPEVKTTKK